MCRRVWSAHLDTWILSKHFKSNFLVVEETWFVLYLCLCRYYKTHRLTEKSDVYSFGIVLLEIITNQPVIEQANEIPHIAERIGTMLTRGDIRTIMDPSLHDEYDSGSVWKALELAMSCVDPSPIARPDMSHVVHEIKECIKSENLRAGLSQVMESKSSLDQDTSFGSGMTPNAR